MPTGYFSLILHAHLPFVRHPEYPEFLEEDWLYEAITEVYLPLIFIFQNLHESGANPRLAMNVSPPLCEMLADKLLETRYTEHLEQLIELANKELYRTKTEAQEFVDVAQMYVDNLTASLDLWNNRYKRNLINAFRELQEEGVLEIITCGATHGFLPLISTQEARRAQIDIAVNNYRKHFGRSPRGIWLPECAYEPGIEDLLKAAGIEYFISDTQAILYGDPRPRYGVHAPVITENGVAVFARDVETSQQVWSAEIGYPGNAVYREFYRDIGMGRSRGTMPIQLAGNLKYAGLFECGFGITLGELVNDIGGGTRTGRPVRAVQVGGPLGAYFPPALFDTPFDYEAFAARDGLIGHAGIVVFDDSADMLKQARFAMEFCAVESCGKCTPCRIGSTRGVETADKIAHGIEPEKNRALLADLCNTMKFGSLCALGGFTPYPVMSAMTHFPEDFVPTPLIEAAE